MNESILKRLKNSWDIFDRYNVEKVYLAWSYSRWEENKRSDVDLYLKTKTFLDLYKYMNLKFDLEKKLGKKVDLIMDNNLKPWVKEYILKDLVLIK